MFCEVFTMIPLYKFYSYTLSVEEAQTNLFVKHECTTKPTFRRNYECISYMHCFCKMQISVLRTNKDTTVNSC